MLSVVIPAHNAARWIADAITSVQAQPLPSAPDIIVVANHCSDDTAAIAQAAGARVIDSPTPGPAAARNAGVTASSGEFIAFLDADDLWPADSLPARLALLEATPDAAMVFGDCRQFDDAGDGTTQPHARTLFEQGDLGAEFFGDATRVVDPLDKLIDADFVTTGSVVMRRDAFEVLGGFDTSLALVEDLDLWLRCAARFSLLWHPGLALLRRRHDSNLSRDTSAMQRAYIDVLDRLAQWPQARHLAARIGALRRRELRSLARQSLSAGHPLSALRQWLRAVST